MGKRQSRGSSGRAIVSAHIADVLRQQARPLSLAAIQAGLVRITSEEIGKKSIARLLHLMCREGTVSVKDGLFSLRR